jgi:hypothetical protein
MSLPWPVRSVVAGAAGTTTMTLRGRTPPPLRCPADVMATSLGTHAAYVTAVAVVDDAVYRV